MTQRIFHFDNDQTEVVIQRGGLPRLDAITKNSSVKTLHGRCIFVIYDKTVGDLYGQPVLAAFASGGGHVTSCVIPSSEAGKAMGVVERVYGELARCAMDRRGVVVGLGGGAVTDLAGFVAATWMRGVTLVLCPTTVEGAIDASVGGKNAINLGGAKNLIGTFHQPSLVVIDPGTFGTLSPRDARAGLAESVKHALISSEPFLDWHRQEAERIAALHESTIEELLVRNIEIKAGFVKRDVRDITGVRTALNFGHTLGHAIEAAGDYRLRHGECVALGMIAELRLSQTRGFVDQSLVARVQGLIHDLGLPTRLAEAIDAERVLQSLRMDKKHEAGKLRFVLLKGIGQPLVCEDVAEAEALSAVESLS